MLMNTQGTNPIQAWKIGKQWGQASWFWACWLSRSYILAFSLLFSFFLHPSFFLFQNSLALLFDRLSPGTLVLSESFSIDMVNVKLFQCCLQYILESFLLFTTQASTTKLSIADACWETVDNMASPLKKLFQVCKNACHLCFLQDFSIRHLIVPFDVENSPRCVSGKWLGCFAWC